MNVINFALEKGLEHELESKRVHFRKEVTLAPLSSFKIGGVSPLVIEPESVEEIETVLFLLNQYSIEYKILGGGTNLLISDHPDDFVTIRLGENYKKFEMIEEGKFRIGAACNTTPTFRKISLMGYRGVEFLSTIPGWVGGAVIQNAGCYGGELFDFTDSVKFLEQGKVYTLQKEKIDFGYRYTQFLKSKSAFILEIEMSLKSGNLAEIEESLKEKRDKRNSSQPENKKSAGSVFKNPNLKDDKGNSMKSWALIDAVGMRGFQLGGALVAREHCNFIVNTGDAKAREVYKIISEIKEKVFQRFGIELEQEIEFFGKVP
ncbi:MAG: UDP-N-acetylmuramate dehydrogenase [Leptospiraceae bacterium]|nr:UDP-N-acetylmuramate dehydrogenase [Leptospiraceae bacterium]